MAYKTKEKNAGRQIVMGKDHVPFVEVDCVVGNVSTIKVGDAMDQLEAIRNMNV